MAHPNLHDLTVERTVLQQFLAEPRWSRAGLRVKLHDMDPASIDGALAGLIIAGIVTPDRTEMQLAACVTHLAALGLLDPAAHNGRPYGQVLDRTRARRDLQEYARRHEAIRDTGMIAELVGLIDQARAAGLDLETITALAAGREA